MATYLFVMFPFFLFFLFLFVVAMRKVKCPDCGELLPSFMSPFTKTQRMWRAGGYICKKCGCETNMSGQKITADTPPAPFPALSWTLFGVFLLIGIGLVAAILFVAPAIAAAPIKG